MSEITLKEQTSASTPTPAANKRSLFIDSSDSHLKLKDSGGSVVDLESAANYTDEKAQDAVGAMLLDTASVNLTYVDGTPSLSADVLPAGVDHNSLQNFVANKHVDHSAISIIAGSGLSGGGDLTSSRTLTVDEANVDHDTLQNFVANKHVDHTAVSINTAAQSGLTGGGNISASRSLSVDINGTTEEIFPKPNADFVLIHDTSAGVLKKVKLHKLNKTDTNMSIHIDNDFVEDHLANLTATISGTGASAQTGTFGIDLTEQARGVSQLDTGTTATGRASLTTSNVGTLFLASGDYYVFQVRIAPELLSTGIETFTLYVGFIDNTGAGDQTDGAYFRYTDAVNGGRWEYVVAAAATRQAGDSGVVASVNYQVLEIILDYTGANPVATFLIDGTSVGSFTSPANPVPNGPTQAFGFGWKIEKTVGLLQRNLSADYFSYEYQRNSAR